MHNNVVSAAVLYFQKLGLTTVRFDFNGGIGRGYVQVEQVLDVANSLRDGSIFSETGTIQPKHFLLVGYSYGSLITGSASADMEDCIGCISIAPPFSVQHWLLCFHSNYHLERAAARVDLPRLLLIGTEDNFTTEAAFRSTVDGKYPQETTTGAVIKGADHFFRRREKDVMDVVGQWILETFATRCNGDLRRFRNY